MEHTIVPPVELDSDLDQAASADPLRTLMKTVSVSFRLILVNDLQQGSIVLFSYICLLSLHIQRSQPFSEVEQSRFDFKFANIPANVFVD
ncbi:MAG TPA: hypothetical protein VGO47_01420 [Chlamydiales bacterium]|jgi:hypothetical protein|nr:hypothetical protein [Chlamydiales bacterium]